MDKFPMETVLGFHKDPQWRPLVESFRNVAVYGDINTQTTTFKEMIFITPDQAKRQLAMSKELPSTVLGRITMYSLSWMSHLALDLPCPLEVNVAAIDHDRYEKKVTLSGNPEGSLVGLVFSSEDCLEDDKHFPKFSYIRLYEGKIRKGSPILDVLTEEEFEIEELYRVTSDGPKDVDEYAVAGDIVVTSGVYFEPGVTLTDGTVNYTIPCTRGLSLRPIEIGEFHKLFSPIHEDCSCFMIGESLHGASIKTGLELAMRHNLLSLYCTNEKFESVEEVLKFTEDFNRKLLNTLIHGFTKTKPMYSLVCFRKLLHVGPPTDVTYRGIIKAYRRVKLEVGRRVRLVDIIITSMNNDKVLVDRRHRAGLVDMLLGGGLVDQAYRQMKKDNLQPDERLVTSFLHTCTVSENADGTKVDEEVFKKNIKKCQEFVYEMEDNGIQCSTLFTNLFETGLKRMISIWDR